MQSFQGKCTTDCATRAGCCMIRKEMLSVFWRIVSNTYTSNEQPYKTQSAIQIRKINLFCYFPNISKTVIWTCLFPGKAVKEITIALDSRYSSGLVSKVCKKTTYTRYWKWVCLSSCCTNSCRIAYLKKKKASKYFLP